MTIKDITGYFHPSGKVIIGIFAGATFLLSFLGAPFFVLGIVLTAWCLYFFRNPDRVTPVRSGLIISPADGKVVGVKLVEPDEALGLGEEERMRISIFL